MSDSGGPPSCNSPICLPNWYEAHKAQFAPPICNRLMHKKQMTVMFVGGPNRRRDFHLDRGSEFFYQMQGSMILPIILPYNRLKLIEIREGHVFLLPSCVPHSPQRPEEGSLGLVVERERSHDELDGLRYFEGFDFVNNGNSPEKLDVEKILWERFFHCNDLAKDLVPVVKAFASSEEAKNNASTGENVFSWRVTEDGCVDRAFEPRFPVNGKIEDIPAPFPLADCLEANKDLLENSPGAKVKVFGDMHPDKEFVVELHGQGTFQFGPYPTVETFIFQEKGTCDVTIFTHDVLQRDSTCEDEGGAAGIRHHIPEKGCLVLAENSSFTIDRPTSSVGLFVQCHPRENEKFYGYEGFCPSLPG